MATDKSEPLLEELRPKTVPGSRALFLLTVIIATAYLALIFISSPGKVETKETPESRTPPSHVQP